MLLLRALPIGPGPAQRPPGGPPARGAARLLWGVPLDLNREDAGALEALAGIGPTRARAIVAARPYCAVAELERVPGIGPRTVARLAQQVWVPDPLPFCSQAGH